MMRQITIRNLIILVIIVSIVWLTLRVLRDDRVLGPDDGFELIPENVDLTLKNISYTKNREGEPLWTLVADSAAHSMEDGITRIKNVRMIFFDQEDDDIELTADFGNLMPEIRKVTVSSNVMVTSASGTTLQTDYLEYDETGNILQTNSKVKINFDQIVATGRGLQMDVIERTLILLNDVKAQVGGIDNF